MKPTYRIRKVGKYYVVQMKNGTVVVMSFSLNPMKTFYVMKENHDKKVKESARKNKKYGGQKGAYDILCELEDGDFMVKKDPLTEQDREELWKLTK